MSKPRDGASLQRQLNRAIQENRKRAAELAAKTIREKLAYEKEKRLNEPSARR